MADMEKNIQELAKKLNVRYIKLPPPGFRCLLINLTWEQQVLVSESVKSWS